MTSQELSKLLAAGSSEESPADALFAYIESVFSSLYAAYERHQEIINDEFPEYWSGTVHDDDRLAQMFDRLDSFRLTDTHLHLHTWECFSGEYDFKDASIPRAIIEECDGGKRAMLIEAHFAGLAEAKRTELLARRAAEEALRQPFAAHAQ